MHQQTLHPQPSQVRERACTDRRGATPVPRYITRPPCYTWIQRVRPCWKEYGLYHNNSLRGVGGPVSLDGWLGNADTMRGWCTAKTRGGSLNPRVQRPLFDDGMPAIPRPILTCSFILIIFPLCILFTFQGSSSRYEHKRRYCISQSYEKSGVFHLSIRVNTKTQRRRNHVTI